MTLFFFECGRQCGNVDCKPACIHRVKPVLWVLRFINLVPDRNYLVTSDNCGVVERILAATVHSSKALICAIAIPGSHAVFGEQLNGSRSHVLFRAF
jgi:hypothetical protein